MLIRTAIVTSLVTLSSSLAFGQSYYDSSYTIRNVGTLNYRVYLPENYDPNGPKLPVVLYLHSAAERGDTTGAILSNTGPGYEWTNTWAPELIDATQTGDHQAIVIMPQSGSGKVWAAINAGDKWGVGDYTNATQGTITSQLRLANSIVDQVVSTNHGDTNRLYVTGPSMGGFGTWDLISRYPNKYAAAAPLSGGGNLDAAGSTLASMPIWMYHGSGDGLINVTNSDQLFIKLLQSGNNPIYSRISTAAHDGWDTFYTPETYTTSDPNNATGIGNDFYDWMFSQSLTQRQVVQRPSEIQPYVIGFTYTIGTSNVFLGTSGDGTKGMVYNNMQAKSVSNLKNVLGYASKVSMVVRSGTLHYDTTTITPGDKVKAFLPSNLNQAAYISKSESMVLEINNLDDSMWYTIDLYGSSNSGLAGIGKYEITGLNTQSGLLNALGNFDTLLTFYNVQSVNGIINLKMTVSSGQRAYLNALRVTPNVVPVPEPATLSLLGLGALLMCRRRLS